MYYEYFQSVLCGHVGCVDVGDGVVIFLIVKVSPLSAAGSLPVVERVNYIYTQPPVEQ